MQARRHTVATVLHGFMLAGLMVLTVLAYWPSLHGGYLFDDGIYFVNNPDIHVTTLRLGDWAKAALSQAGNNQFRALSALSFAANYYFTGCGPVLGEADQRRHPFAQRHVIVSDAARTAAPLGIGAAKRTVWPLPKRKLGMVAVLIAGAWLLLPINLTGVAYVSQRMESLANVFVFLGLFWYLRVRQALYSGTGNPAMLWLSLLTCMLVWGF